MPSTYLPIDKGIPIPGAMLPRKSTRGYRVPWARMEIGDSVLVLGKNCEEARAMVEKPRRRLCIRFAIRTVVGGIRIWRVE